VNRQLLAVGHFGHQAMRVFGVVEDERSVRDIARHTQKADRLRVSLVDVGNGHRMAAQIDALLNAVDADGNLFSRDEVEVGPIAPASSLCLAAMYESMTSAGT